MNDDIALISKYLDEEFYLSQIPEARHSALSPAEHYLRIGGFLGINPNRSFSSTGYLDAHPDVAAAQVNPYLHYLQNGISEDRTLGDPTYRRVEAIEKPLLLLNYFRPRFWPHTEGMLDRLGDTVHDFVLRQAKTDLPPLEEPDQEDKLSPTDPGADHAFIKHLNAQRAGRTLSLDIWDTLLRRRCHPDEVKLRTARTLWLRGRHVAPHLAALHPVDVLQARRMAEALQANEVGEYRFSDAAELWLDMLDLNGHFSPDDLVEIDLAVEKETSFPDPTILALLEENTERVICVSDFYHEADALSALLSHHKLDQIEEVYASCDHMLPKRTGELFDVVFEGEECGPEDLFHVGDRADADVTMPRQRGIDAEQYVNLWHESHGAQDHARFWTHVSGDTRRHEAALLALLDVPEPDNGDPLPVEAMGIVLAGFGLHIIEQAMRLAVDEVFFCTREGVFFREVYDALAQLDVYELGAYPTSETLHVSRRATFGPSLKTFTMKELMRMWNQYSQQSLGMLATSLNIDPADWATFADAEKLSLDETIDLPWEDSRVQRLMRNQGFIDTVREALWEQRSNVQTYLSGRGLASRAKTQNMMVDIGWRGTIQESLSELVRGDLHGCYLGLDFFINPQPANTTKSAYLFNRNESFEFEVHEYSALEFLFNSAGGSVIGFEDGKPVTEISDAEESVVTGPVKGFQQQILAVLPKIADYIRDHGLVSADLQQVSRRIVRSYMTNPPQPVAQAFATLDHNETFGTGGFDDMSGSKARLLEALKDTGADLHHGLTDTAGDLRWVEALVQIPEVEEARKALPLDAALHLPTHLFAPTALRGPVGSRPKIAITAPSPIAGSGGHRTIYNMGRRLSKLGAEVHLMSESSGAEDAQDWMRDVTSGADFVHHAHWNAALKPDVAIATIAYSAPYVRQTFGDDAHTFYFVQDHEAEFNPVSDGYLRAQTTFTQTENHLSIGSWLSHMMSTQYGRPAAAGGLGVDHAVYKPLIDETTKLPITRKKQVAFLYQPEKWRRAPEMCIAALALVKKQMPDVTVVLYGSDKSVDVPFDADKRGLITDLSALNRIYNESRVGLCISATNPSRIPFEMMAAGCVPVDLFRYNNLFDYATGTGMLAYQSPESIAKAICTLMEDDALAEDRAQTGLAYVAPRSLDWEVDVAANAVNHVLSGGTLDDLPTPARAYHDAPVISDLCDSKAAQRFLQWQTTLADMR